MTNGVNNNGLSVPIGNVASGQPPSAALAANHSLQGYIENVFMNTANNLLYNKMLPLQSALAVTQDSLEILAQLQNLHNNVAADNVPGFLSTSKTFSTYKAATVGGYTGPASAYFNSPVYIHPTFSVLPLTPALLATAKTADVSDLATRIDLRNSSLLSLLQKGFSISDTQQEYFAAGSIPLASGMAIAPITGATPDAAHIRDIIKTNGLTVVWSGNPPYSTVSVDHNSIGFSAYGNTTALEKIMSSNSEYANYATTMQIIASAQAGRIGNSLVSTLFPAYMSAYNELIATRTRISTQILPLLLAGSPNAASDQNSLYSKMKNVLSGLQAINAKDSLPVFNVIKRSVVKPGFASTDPPTKFYVYSGYYSYPSTSKGSFANWLIDGYNTTVGAGSNSAGSINQTIVNAITAGESINTNQTSDVRSYLLLYQQYYQTAAALLKQMTQVIEQMAQGIK